MTRAPRWSLGVVTIVYGDASLRDAAGQASRSGFDHIDAVRNRSISDTGIAALALPIGDRLSGTEPRPGCTCVAPRDVTDSSFDDAVALFRGCPQARVEPGPGSVIGSVERARAFAAAVPGLQLTVDTGHIATWGEDPVDLLPLAGHVQLRQAAEGRPQLHPDEGGDVNFGDVVRTLDRLGYQGMLSVEYFDLPDRGWPLDDPVGHAVALAAHVRSLLEKMTR